MFYPANQPANFPQAMSHRRTIGPVPPRDKFGKLLIKPILEKRPKLNILGEPERDEKGNPLEEVADTRQAWEYKMYEPGHENLIQDGATKGLKLFRVDYDIEPIMLVYARDEQDAVRVWKREWGISKLNGESDPVVTAVEAAA